MQKNEEKVGLVVGLGSNGEGIIKQDGQVVFVPYALVGEKIRYKALKVDKKCVYGDYYKMGALHNPNQELRLEKTGYRLFKDIGFMNIPDEIKDELPFH